MYFRDVQNCGEAWAWSTSAERSDRKPCHRDSRLLWVLPGLIWWGNAKKSLHFKFLFSRALALKSRPMKTSLIFFPRASSTHAKLLITYPGGINSHAHTCYSYRSGRSLRKHIMRAHRWWSFLTLQCREVWGYVNGPTGFGNMCFVTSFS